MTQNEIIEMAKQAGAVYSNDHAASLLDDEIIAFAKLVAAKERKHWKEIVEGQLRCITVLNDIVGGEGSTTTKNILDYSRMEERIQEAVAKEREACALTAEDFLTEPEPDWDGDFWNQAVERVAMAIRARGEA